MDPTQGQSLCQQLELTGVVAYDRLDDRHGSLMAVVNNRCRLFDGGPQRPVALAEPTVEQRLERRFLELRLANRFERSLPFVWNVELGS